MVDLEAKRARAVPRKNLSGWGYVYACTHCDYSPGPNFQVETCINCGFSLYIDPAEGPISETEALHMQVAYLKQALRFNVRLERALAIHALTGEMPEGYAPAENWHRQSASKTDDDIENIAALKGTWKDHIW